MAVPVKTLNNKMIQAIELLANNPKMTYTAVAEAVGVTWVCMNNGKNSPCFQEALDKRLHEIFKDGARKALDTMLNLVDNGDRQAAQYILDNTGYKLPDKVDIDAAVKTEIIKVEIEDDRP